MHTEIRRFSKKEKDFVKFLLKKSKSGNIEEFQVGRLLYNEIKFQGISCDDKTQQVDLYPEGKANSHNSYSTIMSFCNFLRELVEYGYIGIDTIIGNQNGIQNSEEQYFWIYNHTTHSVKNNILCLNSDGASLAVDIKEIERFQSEVLYSALKNFVYNKVIYIKPALHELKRNCFLSVEEKRHRIIVFLQWVSIICAIIIPSLNTYYSSRQGTKIYSDDMKNIDYSIECLIKTQKRTNDILSDIDSTLLKQNFVNHNDSVVKTCVKK